MPRAATGHIRKLQSGRHQARFQFPNGERRPAPTTFRTKADAQLWLAKMQTDVSRGVNVGSGEATVAISFSDYAEQWLEGRMVKGQPLADRTRAGYRDLLDRFILPTFGHLPIHAITRDQVRKWYALTATDRPTYRAKAYGLLRTVLGSAVDDEFLDQNPARIRGAGNVDRKHEVLIATNDELTALTSALPERYRLMVQLATWCALRFGELTELRRVDLDTKNAVIRVRRAVVLVGGEFIVKQPKSSAGRRDVNIPEALMPMVREHLLKFTAPGADGLLFPSATDPAKHMRQSALTRVYYPAREAAGRPDLRFHDLRHTGAVNAARAGATLAELMSRLGHSTSQAAMRYQHAIDEGDKQIAARLSAMIEGSNAAKEQ